MRWLATSPFGSIVLMWAIVLAVDLPAPLLGLRFPDGPRRAGLEPPGWVIPVVWSVLFARLGLARWQLLAIGSPPRVSPRRGWSYSRRPWPRWPPIPVAPPC